MVTTGREAAGVDLNTWSSLHLICLSQTLHYGRGEEGDGERRDANHCVQSV
jgi:hypothetical protein